eukprot:GILK01003370.1.p1 GENE.GILK01003370.1~~GILK01003370.1.p1  ORF type:complete len:364 (+),score=75.92 GILK01003370.1:36-1094(+)
MADPLQAALNEALNSLVQTRPENPVEFLAHKFAELANATEEEAEDPRIAASHAKRRLNVYAEPMRFDPNDGWEPPVHPKSDEAKSAIAAVMQRNFLLNTLDGEQQEILKNAFLEKNVSAGTTIITQGDEGDNFYIIHKGICEIFVKGVGLVLTCREGDSFGELALMYDAPRAATVVAKTDCDLLALDRITFKRILMDTTMRKRELYKNFLERVPILESLTSVERLTLADALEEAEYDEGDFIIEEGDEGTSFYLIMDGECKCTKKNGEAEEVEVFRRLTTGDYFGEIALLRKQPRAASIIATQRVKTVSIEEEAFVRLLGPLEDILKRNMSSYDAWQQKANAIPADDTADTQ